MALDHLDMTQVMGSGSPPARTMLEVMGPRVPALLGGD